MTIGNISVVHIRHNLLPQLQVGVVEMDRLQRTEELAVNEKVPLPRIDDLEVTNSPDFLRAEMETDLALVVTAVVAIVLAPVARVTVMAVIVGRVVLDPVVQVIAMVVIELDLFVLLPQMLVEVDGVEIPLVAMVGVIVKKVCLVPVVQVTVTEVIVEKVLAPVDRVTVMVVIVEKVVLAPLDQMTVRVAIELDLVVLLPQMVAKDAVTAEIAVHLNQDVGENKFERNKYFCIFVLLLS